jgi:hypothetical protein
LDIELPGLGKMSALLLPAEILCRVTTQLDLEDIAHLLMIGSATLTQHLTAPGSVTSLCCVEASFELERLSKYACLFPALREFRYYSSSPSTLTCSHLASFLSNVPNTLTRLEIWPDEWQILEIGVLGQSGLNLGLMFPLLRYLGLQINLDASNAEWVSSLPTSLETLVIAAFEGPNFRFPPNLTELRVLALSEIFALPKDPPLADLRILALHFDRSSEDVEKFGEFLASIPQTLEELELAYFPIQLREIDFSLLPYGLRSLKLDLDPEAYDSIPDDFSIVFPPNLHTLDLGHIPIKRLLRSILPKSLTNLVHSYRFRNVLVEDHEWQHIFPILPRGLLDYYAPLPRFGREVLLYGKKEFTEQLTFPTSLQSLWNFHFAYKNEAVNSIPSSVVTLSAHSISWDKGFELDFHFPALQRLYLQSGHIQPQLYQAVAVGCPNITHFVTRFYQIRTLDWATSWLELLEQAEHADRDVADEEEEEQYMGQEGNGLLRRRTFLKEFGPSPFHPLSSPLSSSSFHFSTKMEQFVSHCGAYGDELVATLPNRLTSLILSSHHSYITDASVYLYIQNFQCLETFICSSHTISGNTFPCLPKSLIVLSLHNASLIFDDEIQYLPEKLEYLHLESATALTNACGRFLPPELYSLRLDQNSKISSEISVYLPKTLFCLDSVEYSFNKAYGR